MSKLSTITLFILFIISLNSSVNAQDGAAIFKTKCNTCHLVDKASTGPVLKGVLQKWNDAGEGELLTEWVKNSTNLIASGKSKMANEIKGFSPMDMPAQDVTAEDVQAVLGYVDNYVPEAVISDTTSATSPVVTYVPNYEENLTLFYWMLVAIIILLIGIIVMSSSISILTKSDYFKQKLIERDEDDKKTKTGINTTVLAVIIAFGLMATGNQSYALTFYGPGEAPENMPWLKVENSDLYLMACVNLILISVLFYLRKMFKNLMELTKKQEEIVTVEEFKTLKKLNKVLGDVVPIEEEHTILMHHEYDGIRELDNNLPPWWVWMFVLTVIFAVGYMFNYHVFKTGDLQVVEYQKDMKRADKEKQAYLDKMSMNVDETNATLMTDPADLSVGKTLFETNCISCHEAKGQGNIGPNLTDDNWIYGGDIKDLFKTINTGTPNGMPAHSSKFNPVQIQQVGSFVLSLPYTAGKPPVGDIIVKKK